MLGKYGKSLGMEKKKMMNNLYDLEIINELNKLGVDGANYAIYSSKNFIILMFYIKQFNTISKCSIYVNRNRIREDNIVNLRNEIIEELIYKIKNEKFD